MELGVKVHVVPTFTTLLVFWWLFLLVAPSSVCPWSVLHWKDTQQQNQGGVDDEDGDVPLVCDHSGIGTGIPPRRPPPPRPILPLLFIIVVVPSS